MVSTTSLLRASADFRDGFEREALPHLSAIYAFALRLTRRSDDAHDLAQETFLRAFQRFDRFTPGTNCKAWLFPITYSIFVNQYHRALREHHSAQSDEGPLVDAAAPLRAHLTAAQATVEADVEAALSELLPDFRAAVLLVDVDGLSYEEAADVLVCPVGTVRSRLFRARKFLANRLRDYDTTERRRP